MAKYVVTVPGQPDIICSCYNSARTVKGWMSIYCAPDKDKKWNTIDSIPEEIEIWGKFFELPQRAVRHGNTISFVDVPESCYPLDIVDGWLPMDWFRYVKPDDAAMAWWQEEDEYGDR